MDCAKLREALDYDRATGQFRWKSRTSNRIKVGDLAGSAHNAGYWTIGIFGKLHLAHRLAWMHVHGEWPAGDLDHKDGNRLNNSIDNLRVADDVQNGANRGATRLSTSGIKCVYWNAQNGKWRSRIGFKGKYIEVGSFATREDAAEAYRAAAEIHQGEFMHVSTRSQRRG